MVLAKQFAEYRLLCSKCYRTSLLAILRICDTVIREREHAHKSK